MFFSVQPYERLNQPTRRVASAGLPKSGVILPVWLLYRQPLNGMNLLAALRIGGLLTDKIWTRNSQKPILFHTLAGSISRHAALYGCNHGENYVASAC